MKTSNLDKKFDNNKEYLLDYSDIKNKNDKRGAKKNQYRFFLLDS